MTKSETCPDAARMKDHACANRHQCWEPCGELGKSEEHARPAAAEDAAWLAKADAARAEGYASPAEAAELIKAFPSGGPLLGEDGPLLVG